MLSFLGEKAPPWWLGGCGAALLCGSLGDTESPSRLEMGPPSSGSSASRTSVASQTLGYLSLMESSPPSPESWVWDSSKGAAPTQGGGQPPADGSHFTDGVAEAQGGQGTCRRSNSTAPSMTQRLPRAPVPPPLSKRMPPAQFRGSWLGAAFPELDPAPLGFPSSS